MLVDEAIQSRRAVKVYDPTVKLSDDEFKKLMDLTILAPTSFNIQNWRFVRVTDPVKRAQIREVSWNQAQVTDASELIILCADLKSWQKNTRRYSEGAPDEVRTYLEKATQDFYNGYS